MNKTAFGIMLGVLISTGLLIGLALWPLPKGGDTLRPDLPPAPPQAPMTGDVPPAAIPLPVEPEVKPPDTGTSASPGTDQTPAPDEIKPSQTEPALPEKAVVNPNREAKRPREARRVKPAAPLAGKKGRTGTAKKAPVPVPPLPAPPSPSDLEKIRSSLNSLKSAYIGKDLQSVKQILNLSVGQEIALKNIFNSYRNLQADLGMMQPNGNGVTSFILITSLENGRGNLVIPAPKWANQSLIIQPQNNQWNQISLGGDLFTNVQGETIDLIAPVISHSMPAYNATPGEPTEIMAAITDNMKIAQAALHFRAQGDPDYESAPMSKGPDQTYSGRIPGSMIMSNSTNMEYYIEAKDEEGNISLEGRPKAPLVIAVVHPASP